MIQTVLAVGATTWGVVMGISPALQIRRMVHLRSSRDVSIGYFGVLLPGFALWLSYGLAIGNAALVISNLVAFTVGLATVTVAIRLREPSAVPAAAAPTGLQPADPRHHGSPS